MSSFTTMKPSVTVLTEIGTVSAGASHTLITTSSASGSQITVSELSSNWMVTWQGMQIVDGCYLNYDYNFGYGRYTSQRIALGTGTVKVFADYSTTVGSSNYVGHLLDS